MEFPLSLLKSRVGIGVQRTDVAAISNGYRDFINEAINELQNLRSWDCMKMESDITIPQGELTVNMPDGFKELQPINTNGSPLSFVLNDPSNPGAVFPIDVSFQAQEIRRLWLFGGAVAVWFGNMRIFLKKTAGVSFIGLQTPAPEDMTFRVDYFKYLTELVDDTDQSPLANQYPEMVIAKAKSLALAAVNDAAAQGLEVYSERKFKEACFAEARADLVGRNLHM